MAAYSLAELARSGIYQIVNTVNGKRYVGSAIRFGKRWAEHRRDLEKGVHHSQALQRAWKKYGAEAFNFSVLETCEPQLLLQCEQRHIDDQADYNVCRVAGSSFGIKHSMETRERMKIAQARIRATEGWVSPTKGVKYSAEICERMAAPKRGRKRPPRSAEWCQKISASKTGKSVGLGREVSEETKLKIRESLLGRKVPMGARKSDPRLTLSDEQVIQILHLRLGGMGHREISEITGVKRQLVQRVCARKRYEWVAPEIQIPVFEETGWKVDGRKLGIKRGLKNEQSNNRPLDQSSQ